MTESQPPYSNAESGVPMRDLVPSAQEAVARVNAALGHDIDQLEASEHPSEPGVWFVLPARDDGEAMIGGHAYYVDRSTGLVTEVSASTPPPIAYTDALTSFREATGLAQEGRTHMGLTEFQQELADYGISVLRPHLPDSSFTVVPLVDDDAVYIYPSGRGGGMLIVAADRSTLFAGSTVQIETALSEFRQGRRSRPFDIER